MNVPILFGASVFLFVLSGVFATYGFVVLKSARKASHTAKLASKRATKVFQAAQRMRNETRVLHDNMRTMVPESAPIVAPADIPVLELVDGEDFDQGEILIPPVEPELDYVNFQGLPVKDSSPASVIESLRDHGFILRFNQLAVEVQIAYQKPDTTNDPVRATYKAPADIFPLNNLHEAGKAATALWAARKFVAQYKYPEFENYPYL